jgi:putative transposase
MTDEILRSAQNDNLNKQLMDTETAARILGVTARTLRRWFEDGKLEGEFVPSNKGGGKAGMVLKVYINDSDQSSVISNQKAESIGHRAEGIEHSEKDEILRPAQNDKKRYRVHRGEPGCRVVTTLENGIPILDAELLTPKVNEILPSPLPSPARGEEIVLETPNLPAITGEAPVLSPYNRIANLRYALLVSLQEEIKNNHRPKFEIVRQFLDLYNSGVSHPTIYNDIRRISRSTLYEWIRAYEIDGIDGLVPQYGGAGISKTTEHEKNLLLTLVLHQNRLKTAYAITLAKNYLQKKKIESPSSPSTLRRFVDQFKKEHYDIWILRREGEKALNDKVAPYAERDWRLLEVGDGLVADGHRLNFQVIHPITGKACRPVIVLFWDWKSSYPLGWEIMIEENIQCVASALRNTILALGKIPKWIYLDNGKAFSAKIFTEDITLEDTELPGMFARLNINYHFALPYNAQSKPIERIFGIFNEQLERLIPSYTGASIEDKPAYTKRNEKYAQSLHNPFVPTIEETNDLIRAWRDRYAERPSRGRDGLRPIEIFNDGKGPGVDPNELTYLMMEREIKHIHRNGVTWLGWHWYDEALYGLKDKVVIRYSLSDLSQIYIFHKNEFLCTAHPIEKVHPMASESENPKDMEAVKEVLRLEKKVKNTTRKLCDLLDSRQAGQIDWSRTKSSEIAGTIKAIESKRKPAKVISLSSPEEIEHFEIRPDEEGPVQFDSFSERYEFLLKKGTLNKLEEKWIHQFETGEIAPGEWELIYGSRGGEDDSQIYRHQERQKICVSG